MKRFKTLYDTGIITQMCVDDCLMFTKIVRYNDKTFRMKYYHCYNPMKGNNITSQISVLTQNGEWAVIADLDDFPDMPYLCCAKRDEEAENKAVNMLKDFIKAVYQ